VIIMTRGRGSSRAALLWRGQRGAAAVEFAIVLPILVVILFGITAFGIAFSRFVTYISAAREGARYAAVHCQPDAATCTQPLITARVTTAANGYPITPGPVTATPVNCTPGQSVTVSWPQTIPIQIPLLPDLSQTVTISGVFRCE
jgi:Flp pilus assembly protein TadG